MIHLKSKPSSKSKLTKNDIIIIKGYIFENDIQIKDDNGFRFLSSKEFIKHMSSVEVNDKTKFYLKECKKLKKYDLRNVDDNVRQLNLI